MQEKTPAFNYRLKSIKRYIQIKIQKREDDEWVMNGVRYLHCADAVS